MTRSRISLPSFNRRQTLALPAALGFAGMFGQMPARAQDNAPKKGGKMVLASRHGSTTDSTDPGLLTNAYQGLLALSFSSTLTEILPDGTVGPVLAESWDSKDGKTWRFALRKGVTFHDGRTLKADDVVVSINHHRAADSKSFIKPVADQFTEVKVDGEEYLVMREEDVMAVIER